MMDTENIKRDYPVTALAGSMKFFDKMLEVAENLSSQGEVVLMPWKDKSDQLANAAKTRYARMQCERIDMCDVLTVINVNGYIGKSTEEEIFYAKSKGKRIRYIEPEHPKIVTLIGSGKFKDDFDRIEADLTLKGYLVFRPSIFPVMGIYHSVSDDDHKTMDMVHRQKMEMSQSVIVVNQHSYVGKDTQEEIDWARERGINVFYWYHTDKGENWDA